jgi:hypothetical protein
MHGSLLADDPTAILAAAGATGPVIVWSGTLADEPFGIDPRTWLPPARQRARETCSELCRLAAIQGRPVWLRPHARHAVGDLAITANWCITPPGDNFRILLDPASLLTEQMLPFASDHLTRIFLAAAGDFLAPRLGGIVLANLLRPGAAPAYSTLAIDDGQPLTLTAPADPAGVLPAELLASLLAALPGPSALPRFVVI